MHSRWVSVLILVAACSEHEALPSRIRVHVAVSAPAVEADASVVLVDPDGWRAVDQSLFMRDPLARKSEGLGFAFYIGEADDALWDCWSRRTTEMFADMLTSVDRAGFACREVDSAVGTITECSNAEHGDNDALTFVFHRDVLVAVSLGTVRPSIEDVVRQLASNKVCPQGNRGPLIPVEKLTR